MDANFHAAHLVHAVQFLSVRNRLQIFALFRNRIGVLGKQTNVRLMSIDMHMQEIPG